MKLFEPECIWDVGAELGEGPIWLDDRLYFVDIKGARIHHCDGLGHQRQTWIAPSPVGFVQPLDDGATLLAGCKDGLYRCRDGHFSAALQPEPDLPGNRLNDGFTDRDGYLWFGSMDDAEREPTGALYRLDDDGVARERDRGMVVTNGPCTSPDGRTFFHTDTLGRVIHAYDVAEAGSLRRKRVFARIGNGWPDGSAVDAEGHLWVSLFGGYRIERYAPNGRLVQSIPIPCANVTKLAFGGPDQCTAYVTTARKGLTPEQRRQQPLAGGLFAFRSDVPGLPQGRITHGIARHENTAEFGAA